MIRVFAALLAAALTAPGYYHFIRYATRTAPFTPIPEKFDLAALPNNKLQYFIGDMSQVQLAVNDSPAALLTQMAAGAKVWDRVPTSELRIGFGGLLSPGATHNGPMIEVVFEELPPGVVAMGGPTVRADANGTFVPILKSVVQLSTDLTQRPSYGEAFFATFVHEFGHALGLQHSLVSGAMSTATTRSTTKARPLAADDEAGLSVLYPARHFAQTTGSITGRVSMLGSGVNLASVVAIAPNAPAISTLTHPDGTFRLEGLAPQQYVLYVHALPPPIRSQARAADIVYPVDAERREISTVLPFDTVFFPDTRDPGRATPLNIVAGATTANISFNVQPRAALQIHSIETYAYPTDIAVKPPYISPGMQRSFIVATGAGLVSGNGPAPGLTVSLLGGGALPVRALSTAPSTFIRVDLDSRFSSPPADAARHLIFANNSDLYVLPSAYYHVERAAPAIGSLAAGVDAGQRVAVVTGSNLSADTRILFDGVAAITRSFDEAAGKITVLLPAAPTGHRAVVTAVNPDGQSSLFVQGASPPAFSYGIEAAPAIALSSLLLYPGTEAMLQIDGVNANFVEGQVCLGFGTSDVAATRVWVVSPTRLLVNVRTNAAAQPGPVSLMLLSGLQSIGSVIPLQVAPANPRLLSLNPQVTGTLGQTLVSPGAQAMVLVQGAMPAAASLSLTLNDRPVPIVSVAGNQIVFTVPASTPTGPAVLRLDNGGDRGLPVVMMIEPSAPQITSVANAGGQTIDASRPAVAGDWIVVNVTGLDGVGSAVAPSRVTVLFGSVEVPAAQVNATANAHQVIVFVPANHPTVAQAQLAVSVDGRASAPVTIAVRGL